MSAPFHKTAIGATALQLTGTATVPRNSVTVKALAANSGTVYVGFLGVVVGSGFELSAGEAVTLPVAEVPTADLLYAIGSAVGQSVCVWVI